MSQNKEVESLCDFAKQWAEKGRLDHAIECINKALSIEQTAELWLYKAIYYFHASELLDVNLYEDALKCAENAVDIDPDIEINLYLVYKNINGKSATYCGRNPGMYIEGECLDRLDRVCSKHITVTSRSSDNKFNEENSEIDNKETEFSKFMSLMFGKNYKKNRQ